MYYQVSNKLSMRPKISHWSPKHSLTQSRIQNLSDLSISGIMQTNSREETVNFGEEQELINQIKNNQVLESDQYGIVNVGKNGEKGKLTKGGFEVGLVKGEGGSLIRNSRLQQKNLCFNKQIKRKIKQSVSNKKNNILSDSLLSTSHSLGKIKLSCCRKKVKQAISSIKQSKPTLKLAQKISKCAVVMTKIQQNPLLESTSWTYNDKSSKIYYHLADQFKLEINDLHNNLPIEAPNNFSERSRKISLVQNLKRSYFSKPEQNIRKVAPIQRVFEVKSVDSKSFYSSRTEQQSPYSIDSNSTATNCGVRRSQIINKPKKEQYKIISRPVSQTKFQNFNFFN